MSVTERVMGLGAWSLDLDPATPSKILAAIDLDTHGFGHIVITPTAIDPGAYDDATLMGMSRYTGVLRAQSATNTLSGCGLAFWLGDEDSKGPVLPAPVSTAHGWLTEWAALLTPWSLLPGVTTAYGGAFPREMSLVTKRAALDEVCGFFQSEWKVRPDFRLDIGPADALYGATPTAVIVAKVGDSGRDLGVVGIQGGVSVDRDVEDYATDILYSWEADGVTQIQSAVTDPTLVPYRDPLGNPVRVRRLIKGSASDAETAPALAAAGLVESGLSRQEITLDALAYDIGDDVSVGDPIWVFAPLKGLFDVTQATYYRGRIIKPAVSRVVGMTWPVRAGMGVYFRWNDGGAITWTDLTPYVTFETGTTRVEIGARPRGSAPMPTSLGSGAWSADPKPNARIAGPPTALAVTSVAYIDPAGLTMARSTATWSAPTLATDGEFVDTTSTEIWARMGHWVTWVKLGETNVDSFDYSPLNPAVTWVFRVRSFAARSTAPGEWSEEVSILTASDATPPGAPSAPTITSRLGVLAMDWNGLLADGTPQPGDYSSTEFSVSLYPDVISVRGVLHGRGALQVTGLLYNTQQYVKGRSVDTSGNWGPWSNATMATVIPPVDADLEFTTIAEQLAQAAQDAAAAEEMATTAQQSADGKNTTITSLIPPDSPGLAAGDLWWQWVVGVEGAHNIIGEWIWDGTTWVAHTLDSAIFANIDAGKISTGTLAAARIGANTIVGKIITGGEINGATVTGALVRTAAAGTRWEMSGASGRFAGYTGLAGERSPANIQMASMFNGGVQAQFVGPGYTGQDVAGISLCSSPVGSQIVMTAGSIITNAPVTINDGGWRDLTFSGGWSEFDAARTPQCRNMIDGTTMLTGMMAGGAVGTTAFTLPFGSRPLRDEAFACQSLGATARVNVLTTGAVLVQNYATGASNTFVSLSGVRFANIP